MVFRRLRRRLTGNHRFRNRGGSHEFSLNVPPSRKEASMRRRRWLGRALKWSGISAVGAWALLASGRLWEQAFQSSPQYAVGQFELVTNGVITAPQVAAVTGLRPDQNITELDLGDLRDRLLTLPQVRRAEVERRLPNDLSILLEERRPSAWLACAKQGLRPYDSRGLLLDAEGVVFPAGVMLNEYTVLPVIHCADLSAVVHGRPVPLPLVQRGLELVQLMRRQSWPQPMMLERLHLMDRFTMVAQMDTDALFTFSPVNLEKQIARLHAILKKVAPSGARIASVNLQLERNVPATFFDTTSAASLKPPAARPAGNSPRGRQTPSSRRTATSARRGA